MPSHSIFRKIALDSISQALLGSNNWARSFAQALVAIDYPFQLVSGSMALVDCRITTVLCKSSDPPHICSHLKINGAIETSFGVQAPYCP